MADKERLDVVKIVMAKIAAQLQSILDNDKSAYAGYTFTLTNEQQYVKSTERKPKNFYIVVKFLQGSYDFGQQKQPISITAVSEHNGLEICQKLMFEFAETFNLDMSYDTDEKGVNYTLRQIYSSATASAHFNEVYDGLRTVFYVSGSFYFGINSNPITKIEVNGEEIEFISSQLSYNGQPDGQPFYGTNNFNRTVIKIGTLSLGFTMYAVNTPFYNDAMDIIFNKIRKDENNKDVLIDVNKTFKIKVYLKSNPEDEPYEIDMKLTNVSLTQQVRDFPAVSFTFVR